MKGNGDSTVAVSRLDWASIVRSYIAVTHTMVVSLPAVNYWSWILGLGPKPAACQMKGDCGSTVAKSRLDWAFIL